MNNLSTYLDSLTNEEALKVASSFKRFEVGKKIKKKIDYKLEPRRYIMRVMKESGCIYDTEIDYFIIYLKKAIQKHRLGNNILFDPNLWPYLMDIEQLFDIKLENF
jgi:hypothetical protein